MGLEDGTMQVESVDFLKQPQPTVFSVTLRIPERSLLEHVVHREILVEV